MCFSANNIPVQVVILPDVPNQNFFIAFGKRQVTWGCNSMLCLYSCLTSFTDKIEVYDIFQFIHMMNDAIFDELNQCHFVDFDYIADIMN